MQNQEIFNFDNFNNTDNNNNIITPEIFPVNSKKLKPKSRNQNKSKNKNDSISNSNNNLIIDKPVQNNPDTNLNFNPNISSFQPDLISEIGHNDIDSEDTFTPFIKEKDKED